MLGATWKSVVVLGILVAAGVTLALTGNKVEASALFGAATMGILSQIPTRKDG